MQSTRSLVPQLLRELRLEAGVAGWEAVQAWPAVVGDRVARRTRAMRFHEGTLWVEVEGSAWAFELSFLKRRLLRELQGRVGPHVRDLSFVTAPGRIRR